MNTINELMSRLDEYDDQSTLPAEAIDALVAYYRIQRANVDSGLKPTKISDEQHKIDLEAMGLIKKAPDVTRR